MVCTKWHTDSTISTGTLYSANTVKDNQTSSFKGIHNTTVSTLNVFSPQGKKHTSNAQRNVSRRVLSSKNSIIPEESYISQGFDLSLASTGNYSDFQKGLQQGLAASRTARSSSVIQKNASATLSCLTAGTK